MKLQIYFSSPHSIYIYIETQNNYKLLQLPAVHQPGESDMDQEGNEWSLNSTNI